MKLYELFQKNGNLKNKYRPDSPWETLDATKIKEPIDDIQKYLECFYIDDCDNLVLDIYALSELCPSYFKELSDTEGTITIDNYDVIPEFNFVELYIRKSFFNYLKELYNNLPEKYKLLLEVIE